MKEQKTEQPTEAKQERLTPAELRAFVRARQEAVGPIAALRMIEALLNDQYEMVPGLDTIDLETGVIRRVRRTETKA